MFGIGLSAVTDFLGSTLGKVAIAGLVAIAAYGGGYLKGRLVEARLTGAAFTAAQLQAKDAELATVRAEAAHNAAVAETANAELEDLNERHRRLAQSLNRAGTCDPFDAGELRQLNEVLGYPGDQPDAAAGGADKGSRPAASVGARGWILECAGKYQGAREQLRGLRAWIARHPALAGPR